MKVKIACHTCEGATYILEDGYDRNEKIKIVCPECDGRGYVLMEKWEKVTV